MTNANDPTDETVPEWLSRAVALHEHGGIPPERAKVVALRENGLPYREIGEILDISSQGSLYNQLREYNETLRHAEWLVEHAERIEDLSYYDEENDPQNGEETPSGGTGQ